jgi:DNA-binding CsgD family transcriptional regulator
MWTFEQYVEQSQEAGTVAELKSLFDRVMTDEGFENHFMGAAPHQEAPEAIWVRFPDGHFENYVAESWMQVDPILAFTLRTTRPYCWDDIATSLEFTPSQVALLDECKRVGVHSITAIPIRGPDGRCTVVGVSSRHANRRDPKRAKIVHAMCAQTWDRFAQLARYPLEDSGRNCATENLTRRELEVLNWMKHGKSNTDISEILNLSIKTIEYHVSNVFRKLGATNRVTAVVIAIRDDLLKL